MVANAAVCTKQSAGDYLRQHAELSLEDNQQLTAWDRSLVPAKRNLTYPVEGHPVPEVKVDLRGGKKKQGKRTRVRERRQSFISAGIEQGSYNLV